MKITRQIGAWFPTRAFGFINVLTDGKLIGFFFHLNDVVFGVPAVGADVQFIASTGKKGPKALQVEVQASEAVETTPSNPSQEETSKAVA